MRGDKTRGDGLGKYLIWYFGADNELWESSHASSLCAMSFTSLLI